MFEVYNPIRRQWKRIEVDEVPPLFARKLQKIYNHPLVTADDARALSERLRTKVPFLTYNNYEEYTNSDEDLMFENQKKFWDFMRQTRKLSELLDRRLIDCNVLSLAIQQVIPGTDVYFKSKYIDTAANTQATRHTFTVHQRGSYFLCVDPRDSRRAHDAFFKQEQLLSSYTKVALK